MPSVIQQLLAKHPLVSDQVSPEQVNVILRELEMILANKRRGAVVEFGCYTGTTSLFIRRMLNEYSDAREFHVYDSFAGLPAKSPHDDSPSGTQFKAGELSVGKKQFIQEFQKANLRLPIIHKGWFDQLTATDIPDAISFAFLDGDFYESIRSSLKAVLPRMQKGGTIIIDDYAREALPGVAKAVAHDAAQLASQAQISHNLAIIHL